MGEGWGNHPEVFSQGEAISSGQHHIENGEVDMFGMVSRQSFTTVPHQVNRIPAESEQIVKDQTQGGVILDKQNVPWTTAHGAKSGRTMVNWLPPPSRRVH